MRLLLLLSALLTALTGAVVGSAAAAQPVVASSSASHAKPGNAATITAPVADAMRGAFAARGSWHAAPAPIMAIARKSYGERRRE